MTLPILLKQTDATLVKKESRKRKSVPVRSRPKGYKDIEPGVIFKLEFGSMQGWIIRSNVNAMVSPSAEPVSPQVEPTLSQDSTAVNTPRKWSTRSSSRTTSETSSPVMKRDVISSPSLRSRSRQGSATRARSNRLK